MKIMHADLLTSLTAHGLGAGSGEAGLRPAPAARPGTPTHQGELALRAARLSKGSVMYAISRFFDWLSSEIAERERMSHEAYLAQASDYCDLEYRLRQLEREPTPLPNWW